MSGFGGAVKLTGESEYRRALNQISQNLREVSSEMKAVSSSFDTNDRSTQALSAKAQVLNKQLTEQTAKLNTLKAQYALMSTQYDQQTDKHQKLVNSYNAEKAKLDELGRTVGTTSKEYQDQKKVVENLADEVKKSTSAQDANEKSMSKMRIEINNAQADCNKTAREIEKLGEKTEEAGKGAEEAKEGYIDFGGVLTNLATTAIQSAIDGMKKLGAKVVEIGKQAYGSYANYEQLVGGVETLFGDSADQLMNYANVAYKTAGLSANQYMEQATSFSATLLQGLGGDTKKAVEYANMAIIDMSDNANKMGTDMGMIQNAYNGFAKQNYTMLDNLKLGYGGTQSEMARLINDSGVLGDKVKVTAKTVKDVPFDKIIEAIHKTQTEIGITGTTTKEAEATIEGSTKSMQASWENLLVGIANGEADLSPLLNDMIRQVVVMGKNMIPRIKQIIQGMAELVVDVWNEVIPALAQEFPELQPIVDAMNWIKENADIIIAGVSGIVSAFMAFKTVTFITSIVTTVQTLFTAIQSGIPIMQALNITLNANPIGLIIAGVVGLATAFTVLWNKSEDFRNFWIGLWDSIKKKFTDVWNTVTKFFKDTLPKVFDAVREKIKSWKDKVVEFFNEIPKKVKSVVESSVTFFKELPYKLGFILGQAIGHMVKFGQDAIKWVRTKVPEIINGIVNFFKQLPSKIWTWLSDSIRKVGEWGKATASKAKEAGKTFVSNAVTAIKELPSKIWTWLSNSISKVSQFAKDIVAKGKQGAKDMADGVANSLKDLPSKITRIGGDIVRGLWNGIKDMKDWVIGKVKGFGKGILDGIKNVLGIHSPSTVFEDEVGVNMAKGVGVGFEKQMKTVTRQMQKAVPTSLDTGGVGSARNGGNVSAYSNMVGAFKEALSQMKIELDDNEVGRFIDKTVTRLVFD